MTSEDATELLPPSLALLALEGRAGLELASLIPALGWLLAAPRGDGHPVLVIPGWLTGDRSTLPLRWFLRRQGHHVHRWGLGRNLGPSAEVIQSLADRFHAIRRTHGRAVSLVGWSLGGIYARELARAHPEDVRSVITLGSPFRNPDATTAVRVARRLRLQRPVTGDRREIYRRLAEPPPVPTTAIYSKTDGICAWGSCIETEGPLAENVEVGSSHCGMAYHPGVLYVIADRLAQPEGRWRKFEPGGFGSWALRVRPRAAA
ncbi:MAG: hypothetical protein QOD06_3132 [Candidatus Binatota bacterium]|nr:hypothetical protein [Candidatus Binatota bacterium]